MAVELVPFGETFEGIDSASLLTDQARSVFRACEKSRSFSVLSIGLVELQDVGPANVITVECINDQVPSKNSVGIMVRERLALCFCQSSPQTPQVRALRKSFPEVPHLNHVPSHEPASLCIYFEAWHVIERSWTPEKFLQRILWWFTETAKSSLHRVDQPLERVYFDAPFEVVLPPEFHNDIQRDDLVFCIKGIEHSRGEPFKVAKGFFIKAGEEQGDQSQKLLFPIIIDLGEVVHGVRERYPTTLGELDEQLTGRGVDFRTALKKNIRSRVDSGGVTAPLGNALIMLYMPLLREEGAEVEDIEVRAFWVDREFTKLGVELGCLVAQPDDPNKFYNNYPLSSTESEKGGESWSVISIIPIDVNSAVTHAFARQASGIDDSDSDFSGVIGGVGALGATLVEIWSKESWGKWTLVDDDIFRSHNVIRHVGKEHLVGYCKVNAVAGMASANYWPGYVKYLPINGRIESQENTSVMDALSSADFLVDATTTLYAPRDLARLEATPRTVSVFLTPSGNSSVLLLEDDERVIRMDQLEAQYYRSLINNPVGENHLRGHSGNILVGAGCRDISAVMPFEDVLLHSANLAQQIRLLRASASAAIRIWTHDQTLGITDCLEVEVPKGIIATCGDWRVIYDVDLKTKLKTSRQAAMPVETGGVIVGYLDQKLKSIYVVDVLDAPSDSESSTTGFTRGVEGVTERLEDISARTAHIVQYIGEWHSHPPFQSPRPSRLDHALLESLATSLSMDGVPAVMMIVGEDGDIDVSVKQHE